MFSGLLNLLHLLNVLRIFMKYLFHLLFIQLRFWLMF
jgi:hypothetical protein